MKREHFSVEQVVRVVKQAEVGGMGGGADPASGGHGAGLETDQVRQFKQLQEENGRLKRLVAELTLDKVMLQDVLAKNCDAPRDAARW